jgi:hypothetical protein
VLLITKGLEKVHYTIGGKVNYTVARYIRGRNPDLVCIKTGRTTRTTYLLLRDAFDKPIEVPYSDSLIINGKM